MSVRPAAVVVALASLTAAALGAALLRAAPSPSAAVGRPLERTDAEHASSAECRACHPREYATWHGSYHRTMTQVATPRTALADFDNVTVAAVHGRPMRLTRRGDELWAEFDDPDSSDNADARTRIDRRVVMITGSHNQQIYWYATGRSRLIGQLPGAYLVREQQWIPRRAAVLHPPSDPPFSETGLWNSTCIACHATDGKPRLAAPPTTPALAQAAVETETVEFGIACEACHGGSAAHAAANRNPLRRYGVHLGLVRDTTTVQPAHLAPGASAQVCGQCHGIWEFYDQAGERAANAHGTGFRAGDELARTRFVAQPTVNGTSATMQALLADDPGFIRDSFWADGKVRVSGREYNGLIESPCFRNAADDRHRLTCLSCHSLHQRENDPRPVAEWADDQLGSGMDGNQACVQCHEAYRGEKLASHTHHPAGSTGSVCYNCHMPFTTYGLLKTIRSHTISSPSAEESVATGRPNACNLCHLDKTLGWTAAAIARWYPGVRAASPVSDPVAASVGWLLQGDAGQRAIIAQAMGWSAAQAAAGTDWVAPNLAQLLDDPYDAVRFIAGRSIRTLPGFSTFAYDFTDPPAARRRAQLAAMAIWDRGRASKRAVPELLIGPDGAVDVPAVLALLKARNTRRVLLRE